MIEIGKHAAAKGVTMCIEPTSADSNLIDTAGQAMKLRDDCGLANVKVMFDTYHALYRNEVSSDYVYEMAPHLAHVHFADIDRKPPGEGVVDLGRRDAGPQGHRLQGLSDHGDRLRRASRRAGPLCAQRLTYLKSVEAQLR